jgi:hypothetical protein
MSRTFAIPGSCALVCAILLSMVAVAQDKATKVEPGRIPKAVMDTLKSKFPKAIVEKATKETVDNQVIYDLEGKQDGKKCEADIREDGTLLNYEKEFPAKDLPSAVKKTVEQKYPKSTLKEVLECTELKDRKEVMVGYEIVLDTADKKEVEVTVAPDGKIIEDSTDQEDEKKK